MESRLSIFLDNQVAGWSWRIQTWPLVVNCSVQQLVFKMLTQLKQEWHICIKISVLLLRSCNICIKIFALLLSNYDITVLNYLYDN